MILGQFYLIVIFIGVAGCFAYIVRGKSNKLLLTISLIVIMVGMFLSLTNEGQSPVFNEFPEGSAWGD